MRAILLVFVLMGLFVSSGFAAAYRLLVLDGHPVKWGSAQYSAGATLTYSFVRGPAKFSDAVNCTAMVPVASMLERSKIAEQDFRAEVSEAFREWERAANLLFTYVEESANADILIGAQEKPHGIAFTNVWHSPVAGSEIATLKRASICFNPRLTWESDFDGNMQTLSVRQVTAHEIGHAIGLDHPGKTGQLMGYSYSEELPGLHAGDVMGAVKLYGLPPSSSTSRR